MHSALTISQTATWIAAATDKATGKVVALITIVDNEDSSHELKLDVVCSYAAHRHIGRALLEYVMSFARGLGKSVLVLFATTGARPIWIRNWGFRERLVVRDPNTGQCSYGRWMRVRCTGHGSAESCHCHRLTKIIKDF